MREHTHTNNTTVELTINSPCYAYEPVRRHSDIISVQSVYYDSTMTSHWYGIWLWWQCRNTDKATDQTMIECHHMSVSVDLCLSVCLSVCASVTIITKSVTSSNIIHVIQHELPHVILWHRKHAHTHTHTHTFICWQQKTSDIFSDKQYMNKPHIKRVVYCQHWLHTHI